jgi:fatty acid desaturase
VPLLLPLLLYLPIHQAHHNAQAYGTGRDGEYEQFKGRLVGMTLRLLGLNLLLPLALLVRFAILTPLGAVVPLVRREVIPAFVHLSLRMPFKAPEMRGAAAAEARWVEVACMLWAWLLLAGLFGGQHVLVGMWALVLVTVATLNTVRALCSTHLYVEQPRGRDTLGQLADSLNIDGNGLLTKLLCPVGLQYHALHHLAPYLPYHALPQAHRRLMAQLPPDSLYHRVTVPNLYQGWRRLVQATDARAEPPVSRVTPS